MKKNQGNKLRLFIGLMALSTLAIASDDLFTDTFSQFQLGQVPVSATNVPLTCTANPGGVPNKTMTFQFPQPTVGNWSMLVTPSYPLTWKGVGPTASWAYKNDALYFHAELNWPAGQSAASDQGFAFLTNQTFDPAQYLSAQETLSLDACKNSSAFAACIIGPAVINSESNYRSAYVDMTTGQSPIPVIRGAPCDSQQLYYADGTGVTANPGVPVTLRIDYLGSPQESTPGGWNYFFNGVQVYLKTTSPSYTRSNVPTPSEPYNYLQAPLLPSVGPTRLGTYLTVSGPNSSASNGSYVEGHILLAAVYQFNLVPANLITLTASNESGGKVIAGTAPTLNGWNSGAFGPGWIQLDLGSVMSVKKIRLYTSQSPSGATINVVTGSTAVTATGSLYAPIALATISGVTANQQWLDVEFPAWQALRYIRIATTSSPSWVAWGQIQVYN